MFVVASKSGLFCIPQVSFYVLLNEFDFEDAAEFLELIDTDSSNLTFDLPLTEVWKFISYPNDCSREFQRCKNLKVPSSPSSHLFTLQRLDFKNRSREF